jgi:hypothetical protein
METRWLRSQTTSASGAITAVYLWVGEWEDSEGNVIRYNLLAQEGESAFVRAYAAYVPAALVKAGPEGRYR